MRKRIGFFVFALLIALLAPSLVLAEKAEYAASAKGFGGEVMVKLVFEEDALSDCVVVGDGETEGIGSEAVKQMPGQIIAAQSWEVDGVAGATVTSAAIREAAKAAWDEARGIAAVAQPRFIAGTYQGSALGFGGAIELSVTVSDNEIVSVDIIRQSETKGVGENAIEILPGRIVAAQSAGVDGISGCTVTSGAIFKAVREALQKTGVDMKTVTFIPEQISMAGAPAIEQSTDVVVVGAGPAGMTAAISAMENGCTVILLEKMAFVGGSSAISGGSVNGGTSRHQAACGLEMKDSVDQIFLDIMKHGEYRADARIARLYAENVGQTFDWLVDDLGVVFEDQPNYAAEHTVQRAFKSESNPLCYSTIQKLKENVLDKGAKLLLNTRAYALITDADGAVRGVKARGENDQEYLFHAKSVVLATGGFGYARDLLTDNLSSCLYYGAVSSTGDGLKMATEIGADTINLDCGKCVPDGFEYATGLGKSTSNGNKVAFLNASAILLNYEGKRFADESGARERFAEMIRQSPTNMNYLFMDSASWDVFQTKNATFSLEDAEHWFAANGTKTPLFIRADTIEEAAAAAGLDAQTVLDTVKRYNSFVEQGVDEDFGRTYLNMPIGEGPYYIIEQKLRFATTLGGLRTNTNLEVSSVNGESIPGLFAAGEVVGGAQGSNALVGGNNGWAMTSGHLAGIASSEYARK